MGTSNSLGNHMNRFGLSIAAAKSYAKELPREAAKAATNLEKLHKEIADLDAQQEKAKQQLVGLTKQLAAKVQAATEERGRIVRLAEATFGPRDPRLREFRPATQGQMTRRIKAPAAPQA